MVDNNCYAITIIVSLKETDKSIISCVESIKNQTIGVKNIQLIIVNYNSYDIKDKIIEIYAEYNHMNIEVIHCDTDNKSVALNYARGHAKGKYILFMDAEDSLYNNTLYNLILFFDKRYEEVDVVIPYVIETDLTGKFYDEADLYKKYLLNTGVYDIKKIPFALKNVVVCIKNGLNTKWEENVTFHEDKLFFLQSIANNGYFGFMKEAKYKKVIDGDEHKSYLRIFKQISEMVLDVLERIIDIYDYKIEYGAQSTILSILQSHVMEDDSFWPHQYDEKDFEVFNNRVKRILYYIDVKTILLLEFLDDYEKTYWIRLKQNKNVQMSFYSDAINISVDLEKLVSTKTIEWTLRRMMVQKNHITIYGDFKSPVFDFLTEIDNVSFKAKINNKEMKQLDVKPSFASYPKGSRIKMNNYVAFKLKLDVLKVQKLEMFVDINDKLYKTKIVNCYNTVFGNKLKLKEATVGNVFVTQIKKKQLTFELLDDKELLGKRKIVTELFKSRKNVYEIRKECDKFLGRKIWLYNDNFAMIDNAYYLFIHNLKKNDGVERYYIIKDTEASVYTEADDNLKKHFLIYGSYEHILCFLNAEKIFTAFTSGLEWRALQHNEMYQYWDIFRAEIILLSHGVLNQYWPWSFSPIRMPVDKVVISTKSEEEAWEKNGFWKEDYIYSGMPRYERIIENSLGINPKRRILIALSWRMYLAGKHEILLDAATPRIALDDIFLQSSYFNNLMKLLNNKTLATALERFDVEIDVNLHPQFQRLYKDHVKLDNPRVRLTEGTLHLEDYMAMISDVSSIIFDFALFKRPIQYFIPDIVEFKSGCNHFRELIIPFEDGLGPCAVTVDEAVKNICDMIENDFKIDDYYLERLDDLHINVESPCDIIYDYCRN